jgi:hypothetical protein
VSGCIFGVAHLTIAPFIHKQFALLTLINDNIGDLSSGNMKMARFSMEHTAIICYEFVTIYINN